MSFAPAMRSTTASSRRKLTSAKRRTPISEPIRPPTTAGKANTRVAGDSACTLDTCPRSPAIEFSSMNAEEAPAVSRKLAHPMNNRSGLRKIQPPRPVSPEMKPSTAAPKISSPRIATCELFSTVVASQGSLDVSQRRRLSEGHQPAPPYISIQPGGLAGQ